MSGMDRACRFAGHAKNLYECPVCHRRIYGNAFFTHMSSRHTKEYWRMKGFDEHSNYIGAEEAPLVNNTH